MFVLPTAWTLKPPADYSPDFQRYLWLLEFYMARREKARAAGSLIWPQVAFSYTGTGVVGKAVRDATGGLTITDSDVTRTLYTLNGPGGANPTLPATVNPDYIPDNWDVIIAFDDDTPWKQVRAPLISFTTGDGASVAATLTVNIDDYVTAGNIPSTDCRGCKYYCIWRKGVVSGGRQGMWWADRDYLYSRWLDYPNMAEYDKGAIEKAQSGFAILASTLPDSLGRKRAFASDELKDKDLMVYAQQKLRRLRITKSDTVTAADVDEVFILETDVGKPRVYFAQNPWVVAGDYSIIAAKTMGWPGRIWRPPTLDYMGVKDGAYVHDADDTLVSRETIIADEIELSDGEDEFDCPDCGAGECDKEAFYRDVWTSPANVCGTPDVSASPEIYKTLGGLMQAINEATSDFIAPVSYPTPGWNPKDVLQPATRNYLAGVNPGITKCKADPPPAHTFFANVSTAYNGYAVDWALIKTRPEYRNERGRIKDFGVAVVADGKIVLPTTLNNNDDEDLGAIPPIISDDEAIVYYSPGPTRNHPKMVRNIYAKTFFVGDVGLGQWLVRPASERLAVTRLDGFLSDDGTSGDPNERPFETDDIASYAGANWTAPFAALALSAADLAFYMKANEKRHLPAIQSLLEADARGTVTRGSDRYFTDDDKDWWAEWFAGGTRRTESGVITGVGANSISDSTKIGAPAWDAARFNGFDPWVGFVLEITHEGAIYKAPIISSTPATGTIGYLSTLNIPKQAGDAWRIREPDYILNRWKGRRVTFTRPDGTSFTKTINYSDDNTCWGEWEEDVTGYAYIIAYLYPGIVLKWDGATWNTLDGMDASGRLPARLFHVDGAGTTVSFAGGITVKGPDWLKAYGSLYTDPSGNLSVASYPRKFDFVPTTIFAELKRLLDVLRWRAAEALYDNQVFYKGDGAVTSEMDATTHTGLYADNIGGAGYIHPSAAGDDVTGAWADITATASTWTWDPPVRVTQGNNSPPYATAFDWGAFGIPAPGYSETHDAAWDIVELFRRRGGDFDLLTTHATYVSATDAAAHAFQDAGEADGEEPVRDMVDVSADYPSAYARVIARRLQEPPPAWSTSYAAEIARTMAHVVVAPDISVLLDYDMTAAIYAEKWGTSSGSITYTFADHGDGVAEEDWADMIDPTHVDAGEALSVWSQAIGDTATGSVPDFPAAPVVEETEVEQGVVSFVGWKAFDKYAIFKYDVPGGMKFISPFAAPAGEFAWNVWE